VVGSIAGQEVMDVFTNATGVELDSHLETVAGGAMGGAGTDFILNRFLGAASNLKGAVLSGGVGALSQQLTSEGTKSALLSMGASEDVADIIGETTGGAVGGATSVVIPAVLARGAGLLAGEGAAVAVGAEAGSVIPGFGTAVGAAVGGVIAGSMALSKALSPHNDYMIRPHTHEQTDYTIGRMKEIQDILDEFNSMGAQHDYTPEKIKETEDRITVIVRREAREHNWGRGYQSYTAHLNKVPRGYYNQAKAQNGAVLHADYSNIQNREHQIHDALQLDYIQQDAEIQQLLQDYRESGSSTDLAARIHELQRQHIEEDQAIREAVGDPQGSFVLRTINADATIKSLLASGNIAGVNNRIREIFNEQADHNSNFGEAVRFGDPTVPQLSADGNVIYQSLNDPPPSTEDPPPSIEENTDDGENNNG